MTDQADDRYEGGYYGRYGEREYGGHPAIATAIIVGLLILGAIGGSARDVSGGGEVLGYLMGGGMAGALFWGIGYAITIRHASPGWTAGSLIAAVLAGTLAAAIHLGAHGVAQRQDAVATRKQLSALMADPNLTTVAPAEGAGPLARMSALTIGMMRTDAKAFADARTASGLDQVISFRGLTKASPVLDHCDRIAALTDRATALAARTPQYLAAARREGDTMVSAGQANQEDVDTIDAGLAGNIGGFSAQFGKIAELTGDADTLCHILARRHWHRGGDGKLMIENRKDLDAITTLQQRIQTVGTDIDRHRDAAIESARRGIATLPDS